MKFTTSAFYSVMMVGALTGLNACKAKKAVVKPAPAFVEPVKPAPVTSPEKQPEPQPAPAPAPVAKPDYNFSNIQFEFNSGILKTSSYPLLDKAVIEMKKDPTVKFILRGYASAEGTDAHNMELSVDRANAVKTYLINSGVNADNLSAKGYGEANPVADNKTEDGRVLNRRVEIRLQN
jgi:OOP family OmpA-OmpF porin